MTASPATEVTALAPRRDATLSLSSGAMTIQEIVAQKQLIAQAMKELMKEGEHYGTIPGAKKPSLWKPGADLICSMFQLEADYITEEVIHQPDYIYYRMKCVLTHIPTGRKVGSGIGSCNSREEKYRRPAPKKCPNCSKETIIKGKEEYGGGWLCYQKKGGCGAKWKDGAPEIEQQDNGIADPSDLDNTIAKMCAKRSRVDACLTVTGASDFFTQDLEDLASKAKRYHVGDGMEYEPPRDIGAHAGDGTEGKGSAPKAVAAAAERKTSSAPTASAQPAISTAPAASTAAPSQPHSAPAATRPTGKRVTAADIKHEGVPASRAQIAKLHMLQPELTTLWRCTDDKPCCGAKVNVDKCCGYHEKIGRFRDQKGERITTSKDLSADQMTYLLNWCEKTIATRTIDEPSRHIDGEPEREHIDQDDLGYGKAPEFNFDDYPPQKDDIDALTVAAVERWGADYKGEFQKWLEGAFNYDSIFAFESRREVRDAIRMLKEGR